MSSTSRTEAALEALFERIYQADYAAVWRFLYRLGVRGAALEDLTHDVFLLAYRKLSTFDSSRPSRPWLLGIAFRVASDFRALAVHSREVHDDQAVDDPEAPLGADATAQAREAQRVLDLALATMSREARSVFVLHELEERTVPEIAEIMKTPVPTAYSRLRAARQHFVRVAAEVQAGVRRLGSTR